MRYLVALTALLSLAVFVGTGREVGSDVVSGWKLYDEKFAYASGSYRTVSSIRQGKEKSTQTGDVAFAFSPTCQRAELKVTEPASQSLPWRVTCRNSKYIFRLERGGAGWVLSKVVMHGESDAKPLQDELEVLLAPVHSLGAVGETRLVELSGDLVSKPSPEGGGPLLSLVKERRVRFGRNDVIYSKLSIQLDDSQYRSVKSTKAELRINKTSGSVETAIDKRDVAGIPVPVHSVSHQRFPASTGAAEEGLTIDDETELIVDPTANPPESEFTLSAYGLPEPVGVKWERPTSRYIWFLLGAGVFGVLAVVLRHFARKRAMQSSA